jgi:peptide/nickel transport system substrate-binding protein
LVSLGLVAVACGGDDNNSSTVTSGTTAGTTAAAPETTAASSATTAAPSGTEAAAPTTEAALQPVPGGSLVMGIEADTSSPWRPSEMLCAISCHQVIRNIYDTLTMPNDKGEAVPYLAESVTPNADFTEWRIKARAGVTFHDGTAVRWRSDRRQPHPGEDRRVDRERAASCRHHHRRSRGPDDGHPQDEHAVGRVPLSLMGQAAYMASPTWLAASDNDEALKSQPVGTGPFIYESYVPNESFKMKKNPNYWNKPYPYLTSSSSARSPTP